ncbi:MAG: hypothetical protein AVDCRST_MAG14-168, partial [uncultured Rubrobacteraceae bacterium]
EPEEPLRSLSLRCIVQGRHLRVFAWRLQQSRQREPGVSERLTRNSQTFHLSPRTREFRPYRLCVQRCRRTAL